MGFASGHCLSTNRIVPCHHGKTTQKLQSCFCYKSHDETWKWQDCSRIPLGDAFGEEVVDVTAYVDLLMCEENIQKNSSWSGQGGQVLHQVEVVEQYIGQCPRLQGERNCIQHLLFEITTEEFYIWLERVQSIIILDKGLLSWWMNFQYLIFKKFKIIL